MSNEFTFKIGEEAVKTIIELRDQEPGDKQYALFLQIDGVHGNQFTLLLLKAKILTPFFLTSSSDFFDIESKSPIKVFGFKERLSKCSIPESTAIISSKLLSILNTSLVEFPPIEIR